MRLISFSVLAVVAASSSAFAAAPVFEFRGYVAGTLADSAKLDACSARPTRTKSDELFEQMHPELKGSGDSRIVVCSAIPSEVAGMPVTAETIHFYQNKLSGVEIIFDPLGFDRLARAFRSKYGVPCRSGTKQVQNLAGAKIDSPFQTWCFASGELTMNMYYPDLRTSTAEYRDRNQAPVPPPKVDF